jgi:hypothetical protein
VIIGRDVGLSAPSIAEGPIFGQRPTLLSTLMPLLGHIVLFTTVRPHDIVVHLADGLLATIYPHGSIGAVRPSDREQGLEGSEASVGNHGDVDTAGRRWPIGWDCVEPRRRLSALFLADRALGEYGQPAPSASTERVALGKSFARHESSASDTNHIILLSEMPIRHTLRSISARNILSIGCKA